MRSIRILPLMAVLALPGCDGTGEWLRGHAAASAYAAPLASDTAVVTTRRVWSSVGPIRNAPFNTIGGTIMPDGAGMAGTDWDTGDPAVFDLASREFRRFRINNAPYDMGHADSGLPSPDGSKLAVSWLSYAETGSQLRIVDVATGESRTIMTLDTAAATYIQPGAWTPAGDSVFATIWPRGLPPFIPDNVQLVLIPAAGGTPRVVHEPLRNFDLSRRMSLSPDGRWLLYDHEHSREQQIRSDIYIIDVQGGGARPLVVHPGANRLVGWLPGTDVVLFSSDRTGTTDLWSVRVVNGRTSGDALRVRSGFFHRETVGFADGALFYTVQTGSSGGAVINVDPHSGALLGAASPPIPTFSLRPVWSPDGQRLASVSRSRGFNAVTVYSMETGESRVYWLGEYIVTHDLRWAADGRALFARAEQAAAAPGSGLHFLRLDPVTGTTTFLFATEEPISVKTALLATPDGRSIVQRHQRRLDGGRTETRIVQRSLEDGSERELHRTAGYYVPELSISADGTRLAFMQQAWKEVDSLFVMTLDGSQPLRHVASWDYDAVSLLGWLPAGTALLAARLTDDGTREEILRIELDGSATVVGVSPFRPIRTTGNVQGRDRSKLVLSPAGNRLVHHVDAGEELWRMDGLHELFASSAAGRRQR
jgi:Tol biopolymer transport system component